MDTTAEGTYENGIYRKGDVRLSDLSGRKMLPVGSDSFVNCVRGSVFVDKSLLIADVVNAGNAASLYCRPRRFGKSLNLSMLKCFFEIPVEDDFAADIPGFFRGLRIWDAEDGRYREHFQAYPVIRLSFNNVKALDWNLCLGMIRGNVASEYERHGYLRSSSALSDAERSYMERVASGVADEAEFARSLVMLALLLQKHHGANPVILIDEYDAPVMAGYTNGYYDEAVAFLKIWLTGALKSNDALAFAVLTGVQRISKESIFSDLNNLRVNTALNVVSDECYGFTEAEVEALAEYRGENAGMGELRRWYDGYRFGNVDVYNPWSVLNYLDNGCAVDVYWGNTSRNAVLGDIVRHADERTMTKLYRLMEPGGTVREPLDLGVIFPDAGVRPGALWSLLYLAGYLTTPDTEAPNDIDRLRSLSIPNYEIEKLYRSEILQRFSAVAGSRDALTAFHEALVIGDARAVRDELGEILLNSASYYDLMRENSYHMLMLGLLFGMDGYGNPVSNREAGRGRYDICVEPLDPSRRPVVLIEMKHGADEGKLQAAAEVALAQIEERSYDAACRQGSAGLFRYGMAFAGKHVAVAVAS